MSSCLQQIPVHTAPPYQVTVGPGLLPTCGPRLQEVLSPCRIAVITDSHVAPLYLERVCESLQSAGFSVVSRVVPAGEQHKTMATLAQLLEFLAEEHLTRTDCVAALGGGVIGVEFATFYANLGCRVTLIEGMDRLLPTMDRELGQNLGQILKKQGVEVLTSAMVQSVEQAPQGLTVHIDQKGKEKAVSGEKVLCAIGRRPCWDGLFAPDLTPETRGRSLRVDEDFQTSIPGVYAIGDVSAVIQLAHVAAAQGIACVDRLCGAASATDLNVVPSCIYSSPEIAVVGLTEAEAKEQGINAVSGKCTMFGNARTVIEDPGRCFMKLVADRDTGRLIGAQLMCQHASDIISQLSAALVNGLTVRQLLAVMRPHPSFEEAMTEALERLAEKL